MTDYTSGITLGNLLLEGAAIALSVELACRNLYMPKQKKYTIRILKICMAICMAVKSALFPTFFLDGMGNYRCQIVARIGDAFYHLSCVFGAIILLMRVKVVAPASFKIYFNTFHTILILIRIASGIVDVVTVHVWPDERTNQCHYKDRHQVGIAYTFTDLIIDVYVSVAVSWVLLHHIRRLHLANIRGNKSLYISVLLSNVFRTVILTILNLIATTYFFTKANSNTAAFIFLWPVTNILYVVLIGYDTSITDTIRYLQQLFRRQSHFDIHFNDPSPHFTPQNDTPTDTTINTNTHATTITTSSTMSQSRPISHITKSDKGSVKTLNVIAKLDIESVISTDIDYYSSNKPSSL